MPSVVLVAVVAVVVVVVAVVVLVNGLGSVRPPQCLLPLISSVAIFDPNNNLESIL